MTADAPTRLPAFLRLDPVAGWRISPISDGIAVDPMTGQLELGSVGTRLSPLTEASGSFAGLTTPTGVAIGPDGRVLVADPEAGAILHNPHPALFADRPDGAPPPLGFAPLWPSPNPVADPGDRGPAGGAATDGCDPGPEPATRGPHDLVRPRGLAFSADGDLVVTDEGDETTPGRLLVYAWPSMAVRHLSTIGGRPWDVAVDGAGRINVADAERNRIRRFTRRWVEEPWPGGEGTLNRPKHLVVDDTDTLHVIDLDPASGLNRLSRLDHLGRAHVLDDGQQRAFWHGRYPPPVQERDGELFAPGATCVEHGPRLRQVAVDRRGRLPQGPALVHRVPGGRRLRTGTLVTEALDSGAFEFAWHRVTLELELEPAGAVEIRTHTGARALEPERVADLPEQAWSAPITLRAGDRPELAVQSGPGRYLWLQIRFVGDGVDSPRLRAIDVLGPRRSSLRFLPAPFHDDPVSRDFLDRFLSYFDTVFDEVGHDIGRFAARLSPRGAPEGAFLAWLASWFGLDLLAQWSDATRREFLARAMDLHRARGTVAGLRAVVELHLGLAPPMPVVVESFRLRDYLGRREIGASDLPDGRHRIAGIPISDGPAGPPPGRPPAAAAHRFLVVVPAAAVPDEQSRATLGSLVDRFRPAHAAWSLIVAEPGIRVGCQSTVGVDTIVGGYPSEPLGPMRLGQSAQLAREHRNVTRIGAARIGPSPLL